jgi:cytochrome P450 family 103
MEGSDGQGPEDLEPVSIPDLEANPHALYRRHRAGPGLIRREDGWVLVLRSRDVQQLLTDQRLRNMEAEFATSKGINSGKLFDFIQYSMLFSNGSDHRQRRGPMSRTFAFRMMAEMRPRLRSLADQLIDNHQSAGGMDFVRDFASLIPARTIAAIVGLPDSDVPRFTKEVYTLSKVLSGSWTASDVLAVEEAAGALIAYFVDLVNERRRRPQDDFLSSYIKATDEEGHLTPVEAIVQLVFIVLAGSDTTRAAMGIQVALLLQHKEQWEAVCRDVALIPGAVQEALRFEPSVGSVPRLTLSDIRIGEYVIPLGRPTSLVTMAAMRDPEMFTEPDRFDIRRDQARWHLVFGGGAHRCLGEALAKIELEEGLAAVTAKLPRLRVMGGYPLMRGHSGIRQITDMQVAY